jgi:hypothetical protein
MRAALRQSATVQLLQRAGISISIKPCSIATADKRLSEVADDGRSGQPARQRFNTRHDNQQFEAMTHPRTPIRSQIVRSDVHRHAIATFYG